MTVGPAAPADGVGRAVPAAGELEADLGAPPAGDPLLGLASYLEGDERLARCAPADARLGRAAPTRPWHRLGEHVRTWLSRALAGGRVRRHPPRARTSRPRRTSCGGCGSTRLDRARVVAAQLREQSPGRRAPGPARGRVLAPELADSGGMGGGSVCRDRRTGASGSPRWWGRGAGVRVRVLVLHAARCGGALGFPGPSSRRGCPRASTAGEARALFSTGTSPILRSGTGGRALGLDVPTRIVMPAVSLPEFRRAWASQVLGGLRATAMPTCRCSSAPKGDTVRGHRAGRSGSKRRPGRRRHRRHPYRRSACAVRCRIARLPQHRSARARRRALRRRLCRSRRARDGSGHGQLPRSHTSELVPRHAAHATVAVDERDQSEQGEHSSGRDTVTRAC